MNPSLNTDRHRLSQHHPGQYEQHQVKDGCNTQQNWEDIWPLPLVSHAGQHMSFERSPPPMTFLYPGVGDSKTHFSEMHLSRCGNRDRSETASINSMYCDAEDCDEKCEDGCEDECDDTCSVVKCSGDCNLNDLDDECEDCLRYKEITCKEKDCVIKDCSGCKPCNEVCTGVEKADCISSHGPMCYRANCDIPPPQQCSFSSCFPTPAHSQCFVDTAQDMIPMDHSLSMPYGLPDHFYLALPTLGDQYSAQDRPRKRRREETPLIIQTPTQTTPSTRSSTVFDQDHLSHSHLPSPIVDHQNNHLCQWDTSCQMGFMDSYSLDNHVFQAHIAHIAPQNGFTCQWEACGEAEKDMEQLLDHVKTYHTSHSNQGNGHVCLWQGCNATFSNSEDLSHHLTTVHAAQPSIGGLLCQWEACGVTADGPDGLTTHLHTAHFVPAVSEQSGFSSSSKSSSVPPLDQELVCQWCEVDGGEMCGKQFATADSLQQHAKDDHIAALKKKTGYFCLWAGCTRRDKQFSQKGKVERHMQTHTGFKSCRCPHCDKEFSAPQALQQHIRTHTGEKPYKCDVCGKEFAQGSAMTMHKRVHTGERPLKCDFPGCNKRFSESSNLSKHRKTHNPVGQHRCGYPGCDRSFHRIDQMKRHQKTHGPGWMLSPSPTASGGAIISDDLPLLEPVRL